MSIEDALEMAAAAAADNEEQSKHAHGHKHKTQSHHVEKAKHATSHAYRMKDGAAEPFKINAEHVGKNEFTPGPDSTKAFNREMVSIMRWQKKGMEPQAVERLQEKLASDAGFKKTWINGMHDAASKQAMIQQVSHASKSSKYEPLSSHEVGSKLERLRKAVILESDKKLAAGRTQQQNESTAIAERSVEEAPVISKKQEPPNATKSKDIFDGLIDIPLTVEASKPEKTTSRVAVYKEENESGSFAEAIDQVTANNNERGYDLCSDRVKEEAADNPKRGSQLAAMCNDVFDTKLATDHKLGIGKNALSKREPKEQEQWASEAKSALATTAASVALSRTSKGNPDTLSVRGAINSNTPLVFNYKASRLEVHKEGVAALSGNKNTFEKLSKENVIHKKDVLVASDTGRVVGERPNSIFPKPKSKLTSDSSTLVAKNETQKANSASNTTENQVAQAESQTTQHPNKQHKHGIKHTSKEEIHEMMASLKKRPVSTERPQMLAGI